MPPSILIVDDDLPCRDTLGAVLGRKGYEVSLAASGSEGITRLRDGLRPSVIILDLMMPDRNGFQFRGDQLLLPEIADIPIVVYSGSAEALEEAKLLGAVGCFEKPIVVDDLLLLLESYCKET